MNETDYQGLTYLILIGTLILVSALGGWLATRSMKKKLEKGLGKRVADEEVTSISAWMKADDRVVEDVIHDNSREHAIENAMEDCFGDWAERQEENRIHWPKTK